ncbi:MULTISPECIES: NAD(P)/FAD-dependent oxidoreductase [unclassified Streptomyces]|uniref:NAD(P)/FAD-dependent oxidoreductase n=1 Tax=unclassified Streptomyces TaxID=2593676 RepID=UPI0016604536|nr:MULTISPECIES: FAD-dependent monooxygenase [unclassified Streptomyces]MBD0708796.1 monooxygenase [Streptomyces sp. CBMA291]MBD0714734.1 monooxygenase [Streptomyces sp. CBMA370]
MADELGRRATRHAVVIGGSLAGLLTARVLAEHAEKVTVVERDRIPEGPEARSGVPQARHLHVLISGGQRALDELLPGFTDELRELGAPKVGSPRDMLQWQGGTWFRRSEESAFFFSGPRAQLEWLVRQRVLADPRIQLVDGTETVGLVGDSTRVRGIRVRERGAGADKEPRTLAADLVVDASGRSTKAADWLSGIGAEAAHEETLDTGLAYSTRVYRFAEDGLDTDAIGCNIVPNPGQRYGGVVLPLGDGRHIVTLSGLRGEKPPTEDGAFEEYAKRLPHSLVSDWLDRAEPVSPVYGFRNTSNIRRRYDRPGRRPAGFLATGDALCAFNPVYGQGMAVAAITAVALRRALADRKRTPSTRRVQRALLDASRQAWDISAGADKKMPGATGDAARTGLRDKVAGWYLARLQVRAAGDPVVGTPFREATMLAAPMSTLFAPAVLRAVLFGPVTPGPVEPPLRRTV